MTALSYHEAHGSIPRDGAVISMGSPNTSKPAGFNRDQHKRLEFHDITSDPPSDDQRKFFQPPEKEHVEEIVEYAKEKDGPLVTHCQAGVSRSTAADVIGKCARGDEPETAYKRMLKESPSPGRVRPNKRMLRLADEVLGNETNDLQKLRDRQDELIEEIRNDRN